MGIIPALKYENNSFSTGETLSIVISVYFCLTMFTLLLALCLHNIYMYLFKQRKWRVFPLSMFYTLSILMLAVRMYETVQTAYTAKIYGVSGLLMPAVLKILIGVVEIEVIAELIIRVKESKTQSEIQEKLKQSVLETTNVLNGPSAESAESDHRCMHATLLNQVISSHKKADNWVLSMRIVSLVIVVFGTILSLTLFLLAGNRKGEVERAVYIDSAANAMSWIFLAVAILILVSILILRC